MKALVEGPAEFILKSKDRVDLKYGTAWFQVPEGAQGFTVSTQNMEVVDLGTEFGVLIREEEGHRDQVHVIKGLVEVAN